MDHWVAFWQWVFIIGLGSFFLLALVIIPLGGRDLLRLFKRLAEQQREAERAEAESRDAAVDREPAAEAGGSDRTGP